jgi:UDP:flavonoid glycosyltransferase YjiC (YdhE family)
LLDLAPLPPTFYTNLPDMAELILCGYSPLLITRPADWNARIRITGSWIPGPLEGWQPENELVEFLQAGPAPIYIGFGSASSYQPVATVEMVAEALAQIGQRAILLVDPDAYRTHKLSDTLYLTTGTAHDWLFPQMQAIVYHGGAGTTAASLRAGVPALVVPFIAEQKFWGTQVARIGVGPRPISRMQLTAPRLARALQTLLHNSAMRRRAREIAAHLRYEQGVAQAIQAINTLERPEPAASFSNRQAR